MALTRYNFNISSPLLAGRKTSFITYFDGDDDAQAAAVRIETDLANNAKVQVSKVIREPGDTSCDKSTAQDPKVAYIGLCNSSDTSLKQTFRIPGLKQSTDVSDLAADLASLSPHIQHQTGVDLDTVVSSGGNINLFTGSVPYRNIAPII